MGRVQGMAPEEMVKQGHRHSVLGSGASSGFSRGVRMVQAGDGEEKGVSFRVDLADEARVAGGAVRTGNGNCQCPMRGTPRALPSQVHTGLRGTL